MDKQTVSQVNFSQYGRSFQEKIMQALLTDSKFAEQMMEVFDTSYFELKYLQFLADRYFSYSKKYKVFPTLQLLVTIIREDLKVGTDIILRDQIIEYLQRMKANPDPGDLQFVREKSLEFCRKQALKKALEDAVDQMAANKYESIVESIRKAVQVGTAPSVGHDFFNEMDARFTRLKRDTVPTGLPDLDKKEIKEWVETLIENNYHPLTTKDEIMELVKQKLNEGPGPLVADPDVDVEPDIDVEPDVDSPSVNPDTDPYVDPWDNPGVGPDPRPKFQGEKGMPEFFKFKEILQSINEKKDFNSISESIMRKIKKVLNNG